MEGLTEAVKTMREGGSVVALRQEEAHALYISLSMEGIRFTQVTRQVRDRVGNVSIFFGFFGA